MERQELYKVTLRPLSLQVRKQPTPILGLKNHDKNTLGPAFNRMGME